MKLEAKQRLQADEVKYGLLIKPQGGEAYVNVNTPDSYGPWSSKEVAEGFANKRFNDLYYDDEFGHGSVTVIPVKQEHGKWVKA